MASSVESEAADPGFDGEAGLCLRCRGPIDSMGVERFRVGGSSGGWKLLFGELAELGEGMLDLEVLACRACGHVELRIPRRE